MEMQIKRAFKVSFLLLAILVAATGCITVDKSVGDKYIPEEHYLKVALDTFMLPLGTKATDSIQTISSAYMTVGAIRTKEFGLTRFGTAGNLCPLSTAYDFGEAPELKSIYMVVPLAKTSSNSTMTRTTVYMDQSQAKITQNINVYRLNKYVDSTMLFNNSLKEGDYSPVPINTNAIVYTGGDSLRIYLNKSLGEELLTATKEELKDFGKFTKRFGGLYITADAPLGEETGGRMSMFSRTATILYMKINFKPTWDKELERKDTLLTFSFGNGYCLNTVSSSSAPALDPRQLTQIPVEGSAGINPYIDAQELKSILDNWMREKGLDGSKVVVSKATMQFPFEIPSDIEELEYNYPPYLFPVRRKYINDTSSTKYYFPFDDNGSKGNPIGIMNRSLKSYICDMTSTVQDFFSKEAPEIGSDYNIWLYPIVQETDPLYGSVSISTDQISYFNGRVNGQAAGRAPFLTVLYTVLND